MLPAFEGQIFELTLRWLPADGLGPITDFLSKCSSALVPVACHYGRYRPTAGPRAFAAASSSPRSALARAASILSPSRDVSEAATLECANSMVQTRAVAVRSLTEPALLGSSDAHQAAHSGAAHTAVAVGVFIARQILLVILLSGHGFGRRTFPDLCPIGPSRRRAGCREAANGLPPTLERAEDALGVVYASGQGRHAVIGGAAAVMARALPTMSAAHAPVCGPAGNCTAW